MTPDHHINALRLQVATLEGVIERQRAREAEWQAVIFDNGKLRAEIERLRAANNRYAQSLAAGESEIERLRADTDTHDQVYQIMTAERDDLRAEIERLRAVVVRAKDALLDGQSTQWVHDLLVAALNQGVRYGC